MNDQHLKIIDTGDGSPTLYNEVLDETYHSIHGAYNESMHVFINNGLLACEKKEIELLEVGFGTGLNFWLTAKHCPDQTNINYTGLEINPLPLRIIPVKKLAELSGFSMGTVSEVYPEKEVVAKRVTESIVLSILDQPVQEFRSNKLFDLVYYDAFGFRAQPEMWEYPIFQSLYQMMNENSILVSYSSRGQFKRDLKEAGFEVKTLPGPPGKREMTFAVKND